MQQSAATAAVYHSHLRPARSLPDIRIGLPVSLRYLTVAPLWTIERQLACVIGQVGFHATPRRWKRIEDHCQQVLFVVRPYHSPVRFVNFASLLDGELIRAWHEYNRQSSCWLMSTTLVFKEWNFFLIVKFFYFLLSNCITFLRIQIHDFHVFKSCASNTYFVSPFFSDDRQYLSYHTDLRISGNVAQADDTKQTGTFWVPVRNWKQGWRL